MKDLKIKERKELIKKWSAGTKDGKLFLCYSVGDFPLGICVKNFYQFKVDVYEDENAFTLKELFASEVLKSEFLNWSYGGYYFTPMDSIDMIYNDETFSIKAGFRNSNEPTDILNRLKEDYYW